MITVSLREFLITGSLGPITVGMRRQQIRNYLGSPDLTDAVKDDHAHIWVYGSIEFHFLPSEDLLWMIFCDNLEKLLGNQRMLIDPWFIASGISLDEVINTLSDEGYAFQEEGHETLYQINLRLASNAVLGFHREETNTPYFLNAFHYKLPHPNTN